MILLGKGLAGLSVALSAAVLVAGCSPKPAPSAPAPGAPPLAASPAPNSGETVIGVGPDGTYTINGQPTHAKDLEGALKEAAERNGDAGKARGRQ